MGFNLVDLELHPLACGALEPQPIGLDQTGGVDTVGVQTAHTQASVEAERPNDKTEWGEMRGPGGHEGQRSYPSRLRRRISELGEPTLKPKALKPGCWHPEPQTTSEARPHEG